MTILVHCVFSTLSFNYNYATIINYVKIKISPRSRHVTKQKCHQAACFDHNQRKIKSLIKHYQR